MPYFDYNSTCPIYPKALTTLVKAYENHWYNPSTLYHEGIKVDHMIDIEKESFARLFKTSLVENDFIFNSGSSESVYWICLLLSKILNTNGTIFLSKAEHSVVTESIKYFFPKRFVEIPLNMEGVVDVELLKNNILEFKEKTPCQALFICAAHNETGVIQPWKEVLKLCQKENIILVCDATQWLGKMLLDELGEVDFLFGSAHKFGGPKGIGFMKVSQKFPQFLASIGKSFESSKVTGTLDYPDITAMRCALEMCIQSLTPDFLRERLLYRSEFECLIKELIPDVKILGERADRLWNSVALLMPVGESMRWVKKLDELGFQVSTGSACKSSHELRSSVWGSLHLNEEQSKRVIRISSGILTVKKDWISLAHALLSVYNEFKNLNLSYDSLYGQVVDLDE